MSQTTPVNNGPANDGESVPSFLWRVLLGSQYGWRYFARRFRDNNIMALSAALSFRTIFALIPILVLAFLSAKSLGIIEDSKRSLRRVLEASNLHEIGAFRDDDDAADGDGVRTVDRAAVPAGEMIEAAAPASRPLVTIADQIEQAVTSVEGKLTFNRIGPFGAALLIWSALTLITTMERSLNRIYGVPNSRSLAKSMPMYWSTITLGPVAVAVASYLGERAIVLCLPLPGVGWLIASVGWLGPLLVAVVVLSLTYDMLPNTSVRFRAAFVGATLAVALWSLAKWGFSIYVQRFVVRGNLYGVLGVIPLFMLWLNLSWLIFLFGAEITHLMDRQGPADARGRAAAWAAPADLLAAVLVIARQFQRGGGPVAHAQVRRELGLPDELVDGVLAQLSTRGIVGSIDGQESPHYVLVRPPEQLMLREVIQVGGASVNGAASPMAANGNGLSAASAKALGEWSDRLATVSVADVLKSE